MRKLILKMSVSIDGFVCGPNGEVDWIFTTGSDDTASWIVNTLSGAGVHIMGSRTYQDMAAYWPSSTEPFAEPMNKIPKIIFSRKGILNTPDSSLTTTALKNATQLVKQKHVNEDTAAGRLTEWVNSEVASGDLSEEILKLKQRPGNYILAHGGASFAQSLVETGLIDEYRLVTHPVVLGKGMPLFSKLKDTAKLKLVSSTPFKSGTVANVYNTI